MANPQIQGAAGQAISGAETAAAQPFQMPVAPVAGFNNTQNTAFGEVGAAQGQAQPYYNQANSYFNAAAQPLTSAQINQYYNPMAANVTSQLQNIYGEQNAQNQGNLTQQAGGVGADRIAVGMGDLANQQTLAAGQVYSGLYQNALQAAQQNQSMQAQAGSNIAGLGTTAQNTALQGAGALGAAGLQQQQQTQAQLNAPYQNTLAQIAYQFQTPQYLAGIAGGLSGALGGTTTGNQQSTPSQPSWLSQVLGVGAAGAGIYGALGGANNNSAAYGGGSDAAGDAYGGNSFNPLPGLTSADYGLGYKRGGEVEGFDDGGQTQDQGLPFPGASVPKIGGAEPIPFTSLPMTQGHSGPLVGGINTAPPQAASGSGSNSTNNTANDIATAAKFAMMFAKRGGAIGHYDEGGDVPPEPNLPGPNLDPSRPIEGTPAPIGAPWPFNSARTQMGGDGTMVPYPSATASSPAPTPDAPWAKVDPSIQPMDGNVPFPAADPRKAGAVKVSEKHSDKSPSGGSGTTDVNTYAMPTGKLPYPDALSRDNGQDIARSPWMALIKAGATMAATPGPLGVSLGHGILAGAGALDSQRKELRSEQELNDKAQKLYQDAQQHLDKYNKMTPYERESIALKNKELDQSDSGVPGSDSIANRALHSRALSYYKLLKADANNMDKPDRELQARAYQMAGGAPAATPGSGSDASSASPDPGDGKREAGKWYIGPTGKPQQWLGG